MTERRLTGVPGQKVEAERADGGDAGQGKDALAENLFKEVLEISTASLGADHPDTLQTKNNLATLYQDQGEFAKAEPLYREVLEKMHHSELDGGLPVSAVAKPVVFALAPDMPLTTALEAFLREQATVLPVTAGQWRNTLLGEVARNDLMLAIQDRLTYPK